MHHEQPEHSAGHLLMLTGRNKLPVGFDASKPKPSDWPSMAAVAGAVCPPKNNVPPSVVLPEVLIHREGRVIPGQFAGLMGPKREPWFISASPFNGKTYGAYPEYEFHHETGKADSKLDFQAPNLALPQGLSQEMFANRQQLRKMLDTQRQELEAAAAAEAVRLADAFRRHVGVRIEATVVPPGTLPRFELKARRLLDLRNVSSGTDAPSV
jgi:hypothetical protein